MFRGDRLKYLCMLRGMRHYELAQKCSVSSNTIANCISGLRNPSVPLLLKFTKELNCSSDYLLDLDTIIRR